MLGVATAALLPAPVAWHTSIACAARAQVALAAVVLAAAVGILTIAGSAYLIQFNEKIYNFLRPVLRYIEPKVVRRKKRLPETAEVVLIGYHKMGEALLPELQALKKRLAVVDYDPVVIDELKERKIQAIYGDGGDEDFLADAQIHDAKLVVSTIPDLSVTTSLIKYLKKVEHRGIVVVATKDQREAERAYEMGAHYVIVAPVLGGEKFGEILKQRKLVKKRWKPVEVEA